MIKIIKSLGILLFLIPGQDAFAQSNKEKAIEKGKQAMKLENEGKIDEAIKLFEEAQKLDPGNINIPYELAYVYYTQGDYKQAVKYLEGLLKHKDVMDLVYQLLGNSYDILGKSDKAIETYEAGLKKFADSGDLYLEMSVMQIVKKDYNKALNYNEMGIKVEPDFPSNYYWAAKIYCASTEEVWGMIYGEIFMNLEPATKRSAEISKLLYDTYKSEIKFTSDTSMSVSFSQNASITLNDLDNIGNFKLPFGFGVYEPTLMMAIIGEKSIDLNSLDRIRTNFVENYFENKRDKDYPNVLFDYQKKMLDAGHFEAYNHWLFMSGDEKGFDAWQSANKDKWDDFVEWFNANPMEIDKTHKFHSSQY